LMTRQAAQQGANIQQQAVGQGATMQAQQQLNAINALQGQQNAIGNTMGQMGGMANQQVANQMAGIGAMTGATAQNQAAMMGGLQQQNQQRIGNVQQANSAQSGVETMAAKNQQDTRGGLFGAIGTAAGFLGLSEGGHVPGRPEVRGDSAQNDKVPAMLSPGEIVVPRSAAKDPQKAAAFVKQVIQNKNPSKFEGFQKVNEDENKTILRHPSGHEITIAHKLLSDEHRGLLGALPKYAEGGEVAQPASADPYMGAGQAVKDLYNKIPEEYRGAIEGGLQKTLSGEGIMGAIADNLPGIGMVRGAQQLGGLRDQANQYLDMRDAQNEPPAQQAGGIQNASMVEGSPTAPQAPQDPNVYGDAMKMGMSGLDKEAQAQAELAKKQEQIAKDQMNFATLNQQHYEKESKSLTQEREKLLKDYTSQKVDPNRFWSSQTSGQKVGNIVGLVLSGFGGTQGAKMFNDMIDKQIENDIMVQKDQIGMKKSLLDDNLRKFGDLKTAMDMTKVQQADIIGAQLAQAAAQAANPMAKAKAMQAKSELMAKYQPMMEEIAKKRAAMQAVQQAGGKSDPSVLVSTLVPKEHQAKVFAEIGNAQQAARIEGDVMKTFDDMNKENTAFGKLSPGTPPSVLKYEAMIAPMIRDQEGRPDEAARQTLMNLMPEPFDKPDTVQQKKEALRVFMQNKREAPTAKGFGIDLDKFESTSRNPVARMSPQEQQYFDWAKRNPQDPKAQMFMQKHGLK